MCGISGAFLNTPIPPERIDECLRLMRRRGPDHQEYKHFVNHAGNNVYLLSSRLAIIDLDPRANQPFRWGASCLVYNGEIYNYCELRRGLDASRSPYNRTPFISRTESDTEILIWQLLRYGEAGLADCEGMWAFALCKPNGSLLLGRDRFGEKPLYLYRDSTGLYFGSEPKFIFALLGRKLPVNYHHLYRYLTMDYKVVYEHLYDQDRQETFFEELVELPPAHILRVDAEGKQTLCRYWQPKFQPNEDMSYEEAVKGVRERLFKSVELRLRADAPLSFMLSGGVDSNALVAIAKKELGYPVHTFHIANTNPRYDEGTMVDAAVSGLNVEKHTTIPLRVDGFLESLQELTLYHDSPVLTLTGYLQWQLAKAVAQQGYKVAVSGVGPDELWAGYFDHWLFYLREMWLHSRTLYAETLAAWEMYIHPMVRNPYLRDPDLFIKNPGYRKHLHLGSEEFTQFLKEPFDEPFTEELFCKDLLRNRTLNEALHESIPVILKCDDRAFMFWSVENRSPYLDRQLFEFSLTIPTKYLIRDGYTKAPLRDAVRGLVSSKILNSRRKIGYNTDILSLLDVHAPKVQEWLFGDSPLYAHVHREMVAELVAKPYLENHWSKFLFRLISSRFFLEGFES